ncbi:MAG: hypothetical protein WBM54_09170 [Woeseia sp.]
MRRDETIKYQPENHHLLQANRWRVARWSVAVLLLFLPAVAMQFTSEVAWTAADFIVFGVMLFGACGIYELMTRRSPHRAYKLASGVAVVSAFFLIWINLAVGMIGDQDHAANVMYVGVLGIAFIGVFLARFKSQGMAQAFVATAFAQALVAVTTLLMGFGKAFIVSGVFAALWLLSAMLFYKAARETERASD